MCPFSVSKLLSRQAGITPRLSWFFVAALIPGLLIGIGLSYAIYKSERSSLEQGSLQTARALLRAIDAELLKVEFTAMALSKSANLQNHNLPAFYKQANEVIQMAGLGVNVVLSDLNGQQILNTARPMSDALPRHGNLEQLNRVLQTGRPAISNLYMGPVLKKPLISIDVPVLQDARPVYVLSIGLLPDQLNKLLRDQKLPEGWITAVLDAQDTVVARNINPEKTVSQRATPDLRQQLALRQEGAMASQSLEGHPTFIGFTKSSQTRWTVVVGMKQEVLYGSLYHLLAMVALALIAFSASGMGLAWLFSRHVQNALRALGSATEAVLTSEKVVHASTNSGVHEIDQLARQFNAMHQAQRTLEQQIREMAFHDPLTSLANRRLLVDRLIQCLARNKRRGCHAALMFLDLDNFKTLNDTHGHAAGDSLLLEVAVRLKQSVREVDTVARFGGDEFVVLIVDLDADKSGAMAAATLVAEKIRIKLAEPYRLSIQTDNEPNHVVEHRCTASIGVALFGAQEGDPEIILDIADSAMYRAKHAGRNKVFMSGEAVSESAFIAMA